MSERNNVIPLFGERELSPERRAHLIQRATDLAVEIALLSSEKDRIEALLGRGDAS